MAGNRHTHSPAPMIRLDLPTVDLDNPEPSLLGFLSLIVSIIDYHYENGEHELCPHLTVSELGNHDDDAPLHFVIANDPVSHLCLQCAQHIATIRENSTTACLDATTKSTISGDRSTCMMCDRPEVVGGTAITSEIGRLGTVAIFIPTCENCRAMLDSEIASTEEGKTNQNA